MSNRSLLKGFKNMLTKHGIEARESISVVTCPAHKMMRNNCFATTPPKVAELTPTGVELHDSIDLTHYSSYRLL